MFGINLTLSLVVLLLVVYIVGARYPGGARTIGLA